MAVEDYKAALAFDPNHTAHNVHLHLGLCKLYVKLGKGKDALTSCTEVLEIDEDLVEALVQVLIFCHCAYSRQRNVERLYCECSLAIYPVI